MAKHNHIKNLINQIVSNKRLTKKEFDQSKSFLNSFMANSDVDDVLNNIWDSNENANIKCQLTFETVCNRIGQTQPKSGKKRILKFIAQGVAAVSIPIILITGWNLTIEERTRDNNCYSKSATEQQEHIIFTANDTEFNLTANAINIKQNGVNIDGGKEKLVLNSLASQKISSDKEPTWNTLQIPRGKDYFVELSDGTQVWINAGSKLSFPSHFDTDKRYITLEGEAYFKVKSDKQHPFYVKTPSEMVCVTGTEFNVCAYNDEPISRVTLAEGIVEVQLNNQIHCLLPGEQFQQNKRKSIIEIHDVDVDLYTTWRSGVFEFRDMPLEEISYRLSKWYNVDFEFIGSEVGNLRFSGMTKKEYNIEYFLKVIEKTTNVKFNLIDNRVIVNEIK